MDILKLYNQYTNELFKKRLIKEDSFNLNSFIFWVENNKKKQKKLY